MWGFLLLYSIGYIKNFYYNYVLCVLFNGKCYFSLNDQYCVEELILFFIYLKCMVLLYRLYKIFLYDLEDFFIVQIFLKKLYVFNFFK